MQFFQVPQKLLLIITNKKNNNSNTLFVIEKFIRNIFIIILAYIAN